MTPLSLFLFSMSLIVFGIGLGVGFPGDAPAGAYFSLGSAFLLLCWTVS